MSGRPNSKSVGRELALLAAYASDVSGPWAWPVPLPAPPPGDDDPVQRLRSVRGAETYAARLYDCYLQNREAIDRRIDAISPRWRLARMDRIDRNVLRLAWAEREMVPDLPAPVWMSQWVLLASKYGAERSGPFVNGVLRSITRFDDAAGGSGPPARG